VAPLTQLIKKDQFLSWEVEADNAFQYLKASFPTIPFFIHVDLSKPFVLEKNASNFVIGVILSQLGKNNLFDPIGFRSHKFSFVEINYKIYVKELLTIMDAFKEWCHLLKRTQNEITLYRQKIIVFLNNSCFESY
jgi:hypothetical protein